MSKDHYLPAGFIGRFSKDQVGKYRDRQVWTYNVKAGKHLRLSASSIGYKKGLYNLHDGNTIDKWSYEGSLNSVLDKLTNAEAITLDDWIHVAVPFVAGLFVRGKEFNDRYEATPLIKTLMASGSVNPSNTNGSRALRLQRLLAPVIGARWVILHSTGLKVSLISNDLGLVLTQNSATGEIGWAIPLDAKTVLGIFPQKFRRIAHFDKTWHATIEHLYPDEGTFEGFNSQIALAAREFLFGGDKPNLEAYQDSADVKTNDKLAVIMEGPWSQTFSGRELVAHEEEWRNIASIANLNLTPGQAINHSFNISDLDVKKKWSPPILFFAANLTTFPSGICFRDSDMFLNLNLLDNFEDHIKSPKKA